MTAADATGKAMMGLSIALLLGLLAAFGGALLTGNHDRRRRGTADIATIRTSDPVTVPPTGRIV